ncbi:hypothetical protein [Rhizobium sp. Pop5]|nr:hypothetical protein [Rhizobium sp. Pop5]
MFEEDVAALSEKIHAQYGALTSVAQVFRPSVAQIPIAVHLA